MFFTAVCLSKASRRALTPKRGNKDFYKGVFKRLLWNYFHFRLMDKLSVRLFLYLPQTSFFSPFNAHISPGTRQAFLPGGHRTGAPGKHVIRGASKYRLLDEKVRVFVAPSIQEIQNSEVRTISSIYCFSHVFCFVLLIYNRLYHRMVYFAHRPMLLAPVVHSFSDVS